MAAIHNVFDLNLATKQVFTMAGSGKIGADDGPGPQASFDNAASICFGEPGVLYVADSGNHRICKLTFKN
jgi:hypothetical protein